MVAVDGGAGWLFSQGLQMFGQVSTRFSSSRLGFGHLEGCLPSQLDIRSAAVIELQEVIGYTVCSLSSDALQDPDPSFGVLNATKQSIRSFHAMCNL